MKNAERYTMIDTFCGPELELDESGDLVKYQAYSDLQSAAKNFFESVDHADMGEVIYLVGREPIERLLNATGADYPDWRFQLKTKGPAARLAPSGGTNYRA